MQPRQTRALLQTAFLILFMPVLFFFGAGCYCNSCGYTTGSDYSGPEVQHQGLALDQSQDVLLAEGVINRWHDLWDSQLAATQGEAQVFRQALAATFLGVSVPSSTVNGVPGQLLDGAEVTVHADNQFNFYALRQDTAQSDRLNSLFPPEAGSRWVALTISDTQALDSMLSGPLTINDLDAGISYRIDFGGADPCNGCEVQLASCLPAAFSALLPPGVGAAFAASDGAVTCTEPVSTHITLYDSNDNPLPNAPVVAGFGLWGSLPTTSTVNGAILLPLTLDHTAAPTTTFHLAPIESALGYTYTWQSMEGAPITQIAVGPRIHYPPPPPNLRIVADGLPTCTQAVDVLRLRATHAITPSIQAQTRGYIYLLPDETSCAVADVAAYHIQQTDVISGGQAITYTLTVTNVGSLAVDGVIEQTLAPASALRGAELPAGCSRAGAVVTCQVGSIPAQASKEAVVVILSAFGFAGELTSSIEARPVGAADAAFVDNVHGPLAATVQPGADLPDSSTYLPLISQGQ